MSVHQKKNGTWYVSYRDEFRRQRPIPTGKGESGKREAEALDLEIKAKKKRGEQVARRQTNEVYFSTVCQHYLTVKKSEGNSLEGLRDLANILEKYFLPVLDAVPVCKLTMVYILNYVMEQYKNHSPSTRNRYLSYLKVIFNHGVEHELIESNPLAKWKKAKEVPRQSTLTIDQLRLIQKHAASHVAWAIEVAFNTGVRTGDSELFALKWDNVCWESAELNVYAPKTNTYRTIALKPEFVELLKQKKAVAQTLYIIEYRDNPIKRMNKGFKRACERAGIDCGVVPYDIRHLYATTLLNNGADIASVSNMLGHSTHHMTVDTYYHTSKTEKHRAVGMLPNLN